MMLCRFASIIVFATGLWPDLASAFEPTSRPARQLPIIKVEESAVELGAGWCGSRTKGVFRIQNIGNLPLKIVALNSKAGCVLDPNSPKQLAATSQIDLIVHTIIPFQVGPFEKQATLETNDPITPHVTLTLRGIAKPAIEVSPNMTGFGKIPEGKPGEMTITLTNHLDEPVKLAMETIESETFDFKLAETKPGEEYQLKVSLKPPFNAGQRNATVNLTTDLAIQPNIPIRAVAYLSPRIEIIPNKIELGPPNTLSDITKVLVLANNGESTMRVIEAKVNDPAIVVSVSDLVPGKSYKVAVTIPKGYDPGATPKIITLHTDDAQQPTVEVAVVGPAVPTSPMADRGLPVLIDKMVGKPAPEFELITSDGKPVNRASCATHVLALNFFTSHNFDNTDATRKVEELRRLYEPRGVRFINVAEEGPTASFTQDEMKEPLKKLDAGAELAFDLGNIVAEKFHLTLYPTLVVVDKTGDIKIVQPGNPADYVPSVKARFEALLGPRSLATPTPTVLPTPEQILRRPALGMVGISVPTFSIQTLDGKLIGDAEFQNSPATVLNFVAANCGFCRRQLPMVESIREEYEKKGVRFVNISQTMKKKFVSDEAVKIYEKAGSKMDMAYDPDNGIGKLFHVTSYPTMAVVRRDGLVEKVNIGAIRDIDKLLRSQLDAILKAEGSVGAVP